MFVIVDESNLRNALSGKQSKIRHPRAGGDPEITISLWTPACAGVTKVIS